MLARLKRFLIRQRENFRARQALRRLQVSGVLLRVATVQEALRSPSFINVFRKEADRMMAEHRPLKSAQDISQVVLHILEGRWNLNVRDVQILVDLNEGQNELGLTAAPSISAVIRAHGGSRG